MVEDDCDENRQEDEGEVVLKYDRADIRSQEHRRASSGMELQLVCMFCRL